MSDFTVVDPIGWEYDLHSVYSAYIGYFQLHSIPWYDRSWGHLFASFEDFLAFSWPVITVTDAWTGRAHIVTRLTSIGAFLKMIKTRFGETLIQAPNMLQVTPFESAPRHLRTISDYPSYKKLYNTLPAIILSALKTRVRAGEPKAVRELWEKRDKTYLAVDFEWSERNERTCLEWGYATVRCGHLDALGHWPPIPDQNYRRGHYIVSEHVDKVVNKHCPTFPWHYAFGDSQIVPKSTLPLIIQSVISSLSSPDSETIPNTLVLVGHGIHGDLARMEEMGIKIPHNMLILDTSAYERVLYSSGFRGILRDPKLASNPRIHGTTLSLENLLRSFVISPLSPPSMFPSSPATIVPHAATGSGPSSPVGEKPGTPTTPRTPTQPIPAQPLLILPNVMLHNSGNDAFMCLFALQMLIEPKDTQAPKVKKGRIGRISSVPMMHSGAIQTYAVGGNGPVPAVGMGDGDVRLVGFPLVHSHSQMAPSGSPPLVASKTHMSRSSSYDLSKEFGLMQMERTRSMSPGGVMSTLGKSNGNGNGSPRSGVWGSGSWVGGRKK